MANAKHAGFGPRLVAYIIDGVILYIISFILGAILAFLAGFWGALLAFFIVGTVYWLVLEGQYGATLGKMLMGLKVLDSESGEVIGIGRAFIRAIGKIINSIPFYLLWLMVAFREDHRGLHDLMANSTVVYANSVEAAPPVSG